MDTDQKSLCQYFATRYFLPGWWAKAFELGSDAGVKKLDSFTLARQMGIAPAYLPPELNILAVVVGSIQEQVLAGVSQTLTFSPSELQRHTNARGRTKIHNYTRILQSLPGLRFLNDNEGRSEPLQVFVNERWETDPQFKFEVELTDFASELFLGYTNPHLHLVRVAEKTLSPNTLIGGQPPLSIWKSPWMELNGIDQMLFFRLEKAMQWERNWLHFDGIFGLTLKNLFAGLDWTTIRRNPRISAEPLEIALRALEKLGAKLCQHGLLKSKVDDEYLALDDKEKDDLLFVWQVTPEKALSLDHDVYRQKCIKYIIEKKFAPKLTSLIRLMAGNGRSDKTVQVGHKLWQDLLSHPDDIGFTPVLGSATSSPLISAQLFLEWALRQEAAQSLSLPAEIASSPAAKLTRLDDFTEVHQRLSEFTAMLMENSQYRLSLERTPMSTLTSLTSLKETAFAQYLKGYHAGPERLVVKAAVPEIIPEVSEAEEVGKAEEPQSGSRKPAAMQNIRRLAAQELMNIRTSDPDRYQLLKKNYFDSLESSRKKFMLDLQAMMQPDVFENQLKQSLIKFMIENPSLWQSAKKTLAQSQNRFGGIMGLN